jgi:hypothetical protein
MSGVGLDVTKTVIKPDFSLVNKSKDITKQDEKPEVTPSSLSNKESSQISSKHGTAKTIAKIGLTDIGTAAAISVSSQFGINAVSGSLSGIKGAKLISSSFSGLVDTSLKTVAGGAIGAAVGAAIVYGVSKITDNKEVQMVSAMTAGTITGVFLAKKSLDPSIAIGAVFGALAGGASTILLNNSSGNTENKK